MSGGFAVVQPDSQLSINAVEGFPLEEFSIDVGSKPIMLYPVRSANLSILNTERPFPDRRGPEDCQRKRQRAGYC